ncbi:MAG: EamA family transporter [Alphaproteobacteria bacterium]|nr:EamA family transporter [Alphaproteobacteria bacterium]
MKLELHIVALMLISALLHASWNGLVKAETTDRLVSFMVVMVSGGVFALFFLPFVEIPAAAALPFLLASALIHYVYYFTLLNAYAHGDLSHVYPIARGSAPALVAVISAVVAGEFLTLREVAGVGLVSLGIGSLAIGRSASGGGDPLKATIFALITGALIAAYSVVDGLGARAAGNPLSYIVWLNLLESPGILIYVLAQRGWRIMPALRKVAGRAAIGGTIATFGYGIAIWALSLGAMAHVAALRETSVLFATLIGTRLLGESFGARRLAAALVVVAGLLLMNLR